MQSLEKKKEKAFQSLRESLDAAVITVVKRDITALMLNLISAKKKEKKGMQNIYMFLARDLTQTHVIYLQVSRVFGALCITSQYL